MHTWPALEFQRPDGEAGDLIQALLLDFGIVAIDDNLPDSWRVFFHDASARDRAFEALDTQFPDVSARAIDVLDEDWAARSQANLSAVRVGNIVVAPPWDASLNERDEAGAGERPVVIVIQPSMGFGTGHHATTRLCLAALQEQNLRGLRVLDVGTGSAVLAIAASRLGAREVVALDDDSDAVTAARENLSLNPLARVSLRTVDVRSTILASFDLVVANLTGGLLIAAGASLRALVLPSGRLVLSGFMDHEEQAVLGAFSGCTVEARAQEDEWVCATLIEP